MQTALPSLALPTQPCSRQSEPYMGRGTAARHSTFLTCAANSCAVSMTRAVSIRGGFLVVRKPETTRATRTGHLQTRKGHTHTVPSTTGSNAFGISGYLARSDGTGTLGTTATSSGGAHTHTVTVSASGSEARPRNIALL